MKPMARRSLFGLALLVLAWATLPVMRVQGQGAQRDEMVAMRDGTRLAVTIYFPTGSGPWPVVLSRTPYGKDQGEPAKAEARYTDGGYVRVLQDARGKGKSEGVYRPFADDLEDGYDTIEWIAKQPWSNGKVGMSGTSALGIATYNAAMSGAPHLVAAFVTAARGYTPPAGGVPMQHLEDWSRRQGVTANPTPRPTFRTYAANAGARDLRSYAGKITVPFYNVGGWYDIFESGILDGYTFLQTQGAPSIRGKNKLMLAAFGHGPLSGDLKYPADGGSIAMGDPIRWFDYWLKGIDNGVMNEPAVRYFVMGDTMDPSAPGNVWRTADRGRRNRRRPRTTSPPTASSRRRVRPAISRRRTLYDPKNPAPTAGGNNLGLDRGPMDQRPVSARKDVLKFETAPLTEAVEITGPLSAELVGLDRRARHGLHGQAGRRLSQRLRSARQRRRIPPALYGRLRQAGARGPRQAGTRSRSICGRRHWCSIPDTRSPCT